MQQKETSIESTASEVKTDFSPLNASCSQFKTYFRTIACSF